MLRVLKKNILDETVLLSTRNILLQLKEKKILTNVSSKSILYLDLWQMLSDVDMLRCKILIS